VPAPPTTAALTNRAVPQQHRAVGGDLRTRTAHALGLIRKLIDYGKELAGTLQQRPSAETLFDITRCFGTLSIALILARITRGLRIAAAPEARLASRPARPEQAHATARAPSPRKPSAARPPARHQDDPASLLDHFPTPEEIAAQLRHRPIGAVLVDICGDLGIVTSHPLWREITLVLIENGGSLVALVKDVFKRVRMTNFVPPDTKLIPPMPPGWRPPPLVSAVAAATGPP